MVSSKKFIILALVSLTLQCIKLSEASRRCKLSPNVPEETPKTIGHSKNNQALVVASGYLRYYNHQEESRNFRYMPLEFKSFEFNPSLGTYTLLLNADCAQIFVNLLKNGDDSWVVDKDLGVDVILDKGNNGAFICNLDGVDWEQTSGKHFGCDLANHPYLCGTYIGLPQTFTKIVDVVFTRFEFEVFGSPEKTALNQFTTNTTTC